MDIVEKKNNREIYFHYVVIRTSHSDQESDAYFRC
jgi:hypothetical protein